VQLEDNVANEPLTVDGGPDSGSGYSDATSADDALNGCNFGPRPAATEDEFSCVARSKP
jgi:hypothetical protein